jgi:hypothetical protein
VQRTEAMIGGSFVRLDKRGKPIRGNSGVMWVVGFAGQSGRSTTR